jgi:RNA polymerase sigma-70 factor (ECF subfamily)
MTVVPFSIAGGLPLRPGGDAFEPSGGGWLGRLASGRGSRGAVTAGPAGWLSARETNEPMSGHSDETLVAAYRAGDRAAFRELIQRYQNELLHFLTRFLGSRASAEDAFQEAFLQVHLSIDTFDESRRFKPWLFTIAANKARDYHRKHGRRITVSLSSTIGDDGDGQRFVDLLEADLPSPDLPILDAERSRLVKDVVDALPRHLREILLLSYFQKMSYIQIAETLQVPLGTVKSRLHTAVATFAQAWKAARVADEGNP